MASSGINQEDINKIQELFGVAFEVSGNSMSVTIESQRTGARISIDILTEESGLHLVSVYTSNSHLQLQNCSRAIVSSMLEEVIFVSETELHISGLIISKQGDCSIYANVDKSLLNSDFTELSSEKLLAAVALSVTESGI